MPWAASSQEETQKRPKKLESVSFFREIDSKQTFLEAAKGSTTWHAASRVWRVVALVL